jgi:hypothetical protein
MAALLELRLLGCAIKHAVKFRMYVLWSGHKKEPP